MSQSIDIFAILDQVTNTEGVSYTVFITSITAILASFIAVIGFLMNIVNTRLLAIESKQDKLSDKFDDKFDKAFETLFLIKAHLGILRVEEKSTTQDQENPEN